MADDRDVNEFFNERAAMIEHCGKARKEDAEVAAYFETKKQYGRVTAAIAKIYQAAQAKRLRGV